MSLQQHKVKIFYRKNKGSEVLQVRKKKIFISQFRIGLYPGSYFRRTLLKFIFWRIKSAESRVMFRRLVPFKPANQRV